MIARAAGFYWVSRVGEPNPAHSVVVAEWEPDHLVAEGGRWLHTGDDGCAYGDDGIVVLSERLTPPGAVPPGPPEHRDLVALDRHFDLRCDYLSKRLDALEERLTPPEPSTPE